MQHFRSSLSTLKCIGRPLSTISPNKRTIGLQTINQVSLASSARDVFSHVRLNSSAIKSLDVYAHIAFRESPQYKERPEPSFEKWNEIVSTENNYIYRYIHKRLHDRFCDVGEAIKTLPVFSHIQRLNELCVSFPSYTDRERNHHTEITRLLYDVRSQIEIMNQLELTSLLTFIKDNNHQEFRAIKRMIDMELRWLLKKHVKTRLMDLDLWLYLADIFYESKMRSTFTHVLLNYLTAESDVNMSNRQLIHMLFLVILKRQQDGLLQKYEERIYNLLWKAPFEDISVICMAYFKTKTPITNHALLRRIIDQTIDHLSTIDPEQPGYGSIIKSVRYSRHPDLRENVVCLTETLLQEDHKSIIFASPYNAVQTVKLMESFRIYNPLLLNHFWEYLFQNLERFRTKDIQYGLTSLSNFAFKDLHLNKNKIKDLDRLVEKTVRLDLDGSTHFQIYHVLPLTRALATFGYYNKGLTKFTSDCLNDPDKYDQSKGVLEFEKSALLMQTATHIEGGDTKLEIKSKYIYDIVDKIDRSIGDVGSAKINSLGRLSSILRGPEYRKKFQYTSLFRELAYSLSSRKEFAGPEYHFNFQYTMPHQNYVDLVISYKNKNPGCFDRITLRPKQVLKDQKHIIIFATHKQDYIDGHDRLCGYKRFLVRLLGKLGYEILITDLHNPDLDELSKRINQIFSKR